MWRTTITGKLLIHPAAPIFYLNAGLAPPSAAARSSGRFSAQPDDVDEVETTRKKPETSPAATADAPFAPSEPRQSDDDHHRRRESDSKLFRRGETPEGEFYS